MLALSLTHHILPHNVGLFSLAGTLPHHVDPLSHSSASPSPIGPRYAPSRSRCPSLPPPRAPHSSWRQWGSAAAGASAWIFGERWCGSPTNVVEVPRELSFSLSPGVAATGGSSGTAMSDAAAAYQSCGTAVSDAAAAYQRWIYRGQRWWRASDRSGGRWWAEWWWQTGSISGGARALSVVVFSITTSWLAMVFKIGDDVVLKPEVMRSSVVVLFINFAWFF